MLLILSVSTYKIYNFLAPIQVRWSPNFVSHTFGHRGRSD